MTLSAMISRSGGYELVCPSARIEGGEDLTVVVDLIRNAQAANQVFCPHCYEILGKLYTIRFRNNTTRRVCFFHPKHEKRSQECISWRGESEKHYSAKDAIKRHFEIHGVAGLSVVQELGLRSPDTRNRQPDLKVTYPNGATEAIEVQISYINSFELLERTSDIRKHGVSTVSWYLYGKNYNEENRKWCAANNVECFHLWFQDSDDTKPKWKQSEPYTEPRKKNDSVASDLCPSTNSLITPISPESPIATESKTLATHAIKVGDLVTGVECRDSHGWHGTVKAIEQNPLYYRVYWQERKDMGIPGGPVIGMLPKQICRINKKH